MGCGAETEANALMTSLTSGVSFVLPTVNLESNEYAIPDIGPLGNQVVRLGNSDLTEGIVNGSGTFDQMMRGVAAHLRKEFEDNRITGDQYAKAFIALTESAISNSVQYLLGRDSAYWQAVTAQMQAQIAQVQLVIARVQLETAKAELMSKRFEAFNFQANYALSKMKLSTESANYCIAQYTLDNILPLQKILVKEQGEVQRAQTLDNRSDNAVVVGLVGQQKSLYKQQITSYKRDAETKIAKLFTDAWITNKTIDEGLLAPNGFTNASIDQVLSTLKGNVQFDGASHQ